MKQYEYKVVRHHYYIGGEFLNELGLEGWELTGIIRDVHGQDDNIFYFKREINKESNKVE